MALFDIFGYALWSFDDSHNDVWLLNISDVQFLVCIGFSKTRDRPDHPLNHMQLEIKDHFYLSF